MEVYIWNAIRHLRKNRIARGLDKIFHRRRCYSIHLRKAFIADLKIVVALALTVLISPDATGR